MIAIVIMIMGMTMILIMNIVKLHRSSARYHDRLSNISAVRPIILLLEPRLIISSKHFKRSFGKIRGTEYKSHA